MIAVWVGIILGLLVVILLPSDDTKLDILWMFEDDAEE